MTDPQPRNGINMLVALLERDVKRLRDEVDELKKGQPAIVAERVTRLSADIENLRRDVNDDVLGLRKQLDEQRGDVSGVRRILVGLLVTIAATGITVAVSTALLLGTG